MSHPVRIGCSGWNYREWQGLLYPPGTPPERWLEVYSSALSTVELNATFYKLPTEAAVRTWLEETPDDFVFAVKASRYMTHVKRLREPKKGGVERFFRTLDPLRDAGKLGPILWQLPESFRRDDERLDEALARLPDGRHAFELRHPSWFTGEVYARLRNRNVALVISDHPKWPFQTREITADWTYVRLHHGRRGRNGNYSPSELETWKRRVAAWRARHDVYVYVNTEDKPKTLANARSLAGVN